MRNPSYKTNQLQDEPARLRCVNSGNADDALDVRRGAGLHLGIAAGLVVVDLARRSRERRRAQLDGPADPDGAAKVRSPPRRRVRTSRAPPAGARDRAGHRRCRRSAATIAQSGPFAASARASPKPDDRPHSAALTVVPGHRSAPSRQCPVACTWVRAAGRRSPACLLADGARPRL